MSSQPTILAVDDDPMNLAILEEILLDADYEVITATSGLDALELANRVSPDIILLDIMMPGIDGYETCQRLREGNALKYCKIILVSAKAMVGERLQGYECGADDYLVKPFDHSELLAKIGVFARLKSMEEVDRLKNDFLTLLSHETRTPLTQIVGPAEILCSEASLPEDERREFGRIVLEAARSLETKLEDAQLSLSFRVRRNGTPDSRCSLAEIVGDTIERFGGAGAALAVHGASASSVSADPRHLRIAFARLIEDSQRSAADSGEELRISIETVADQYVVLIDTDQHGGVLPRVSRNFETFEVPDVDHHSGQMNVGVSLADSILAYYGARLQSESYEQGFRAYRVILPRAKSEEDASPGLRTA